MPNDLEIAYLQYETDDRHEITVIKQVLEDYIHCHPKIAVFRFFLVPADQDVTIIKQAAAKASLSTGKPIDLLIPSRLIRRQEA